MGLKSQPPSSTGSPTGRWLRRALIQHQGQRHIRKQERKARTRLSPALGFGPWKLKSLRSHKCSLAKITLLLPWRSEPLAGRPRVPGGKCPPEIADRRPPSEAAARRGSLRLSAGKLPQPRPLVPTAIPARATRKMPRGRDRGRQPLRSRCPRPLSAPPPLPSPQASRRKVRGEPYGRQSSPGQTASKWPNFWLSCTGLPAPSSSPCDRTRPGAAGHSILLALTFKP